MKYYLYNRTYLTFTIGGGKCIHEFLAPLRWGWIMCDLEFDLTGPVTAHSVLLFRLTGFRMFERLLSMVQRLGWLYLVYLPPFMLLWERRGTEAVFKALYCASMYRIFNQMHPSNISNDMPHSSVNTNANICLDQTQKVSIYQWE